MKKIIIFTLLFLFVWIIPIFAYVGPGAGFAFAGSFLFIFLAFFLAFFNFITFPIRALIKFFKRIKTLKHARYKRTIIIGFDGMDYKLMKRFMKEGKRFPNFEKLEEQGTFAPLLSTEPPISPVAWSTFSTGVNPGKHNIFDFLTTDRSNYMPKLSGSDILPPKRSIKLGKFNLPISKPKIELKRKSKSFWKIISSKGIFSAVFNGSPFYLSPGKILRCHAGGSGHPGFKGNARQLQFLFRRRKKEEF